MANPHLDTWRVRSRNQRATEGFVARQAELVAPLLAALVLTPLLQPVFLSWLQGPATSWGLGMAGTALRAGLLVIGVLALDVYAALIRGSDRAVLAALPVDPAQVVQAELVQVAARRWWVLPAAALLMSPVAAAGAPGLWLAGLAVVAGAFAMGLVGSAWVHLRAVDAAEDPAWAPLLDRVRGSNPREQAAFLYAPGVVIGICGTALYFATRGIQAVGAGEGIGVGWMLAPVPVVLYAAATLGSRSHSWFAGGLVLAEIDARYAAFEDPEEGRRVYLDWVVRWLPPQMAAFALKDLRHGWRARRSWVTGAWLLAVGAFAAGWSASELGPVRAADVALASAWLCATLGVLLAADEPEFLRVWLPDGGLGRRVARTLVLVLWIQPPAWLGAGAVLLRRGIPDAAGVLAVGLASGVAASIFAVACGSLGRRGLAVYAPVGAVAAGATAFWLGVP